MRRALQRGRGLPAPQVPAVGLRGERESTWLLVLALVAVSVVVPLLVGFMRVLTATRPDAFLGGDNALIELATRNVGGLRQLLGPYSRYHWRHPGPLYFYVLWPFHVAFGRSSQGLVAGAFAVNLVSLCVAAVLVWRAFGAPVAAVFIALAGLATRWLGYPALWDPWNPLVTVQPFLLYLTSTWVLTAGHRWMLLVMAVVGTFLFQTHISFAPLLAATGGVALVLWLVPLARTGGPAAVWRAARAPLGASIAVTVLLWLPPLVEQVTRPEGNVTKVLRFVLQEMAVGYHDRQEVLSALRPGLGSALIGVTNSITPMVPAPSSLLWAGLALLVASAVALAPRVPHLGGLTLILVSGVVVAYWSVSTIPDPIAPYLVWWAGALGMLICLAGLGVLIEGGHWARWRLAARRASTAAIARRVASVVVAVGIALFGAANLVHALSIRPNRMFSDEESAVRELANGIEAFFAERSLDGEAVDVLGGPHRPVVRIYEGYTWPIVVGVVWEEVRRGLPASVEDEWLFMFGDQFTPTGQEDGELIFGADYLRQRAAEDPQMIRVADSAGYLVCYRANATG